MSGLQTIHQPKTPEAKNLAIETLVDYHEHPIGTQRGENLAVPFNYVVPPARIYVRNLSRTCEWRRVKIAVSYQRGAEERLMEDRKLAARYSIDTLYREVERGRDMNEYEKNVLPVCWQLKVDGKIYLIPPAKDEKSEPPEIEVPEGAWDLYLGNYDRMHSADPIVIGDEKTRLAVRWRRLPNPVGWIRDGEQRIDQRNPGGFLEFIRRVPVAANEQVDREYLAAMDMVEAF